MLILNIFLYLIIFIVLLTIIYKIIKVYLIVNNSIVNNLSKQIFVVPAKTKFSIKGVNIYFEFQDLFIRDHGHSKIYVNKINGKINILSSILLGRVKVNNLILKDIDLSLNNIRKEKKISQMSANIIFNTGLNKFTDKTINLSAKFNIDNIDFNFDTTFSVEKQGVSLNSLRLNNSAKNLREVFDYLPQTFINEKLLNWLDCSLLSGSISKSELFVDSENNFNLAIKFKDVNLQYSKNWPTIEKLSAKMEIFDNNLIIHMDDGGNKGYIFRQPFSALKAELKDIDRYLLNPLSIKAAFNNFKVGLIFDGNNILINNDLLNAKIVLEDQGSNFLVEKLTIINKEFNNIQFTNDFKKNSWYFTEQSTKGQLVLLNNQVKLSCEGLNYNIEAISNINHEIDKSDNTNESKLATMSQQRIIYIDGKLSSNDFGNFLNQLNIKKKIIQGGNGLIKFNFKIKEDLSELLNNSEGNFKLDLKSGNIIEVDPGLGRIIGLFNLENIPRRLQLDFSDLTDKGFVFDYIKGDLSINNGQLLFNNVIVNGPSANLTINGDTSLISKKINLIIDTKSKVISTLPLAAAIAAGNPVVGAAVWLFDHASGDELGKMKIQKYKIIGTWDKPEISQI